MNLLPKAFAERLADRIHYASPVVRIEQDAHGVKAVFQQVDSYHTLTADHLICAVPFTVQRDIEVAPAFSVEKQRAIEQLPYLSASKIFLQSKQRFWTREGLSGFGTTDLPIGQVWDVDIQTIGIEGHLASVSAQPALASGDADDGDAAHSVCARAR